ncbi:MAG: 3-hydroxyacyl-CoA dehydrogenase family protein [Bryobacteraceae bacterium]|nr:3-hydroxyacyl-CoA dehydrogenase family protein [Bryobacteraceae bacterium]
MKIEKALVLGTGMMGPGIAAALALGGVRATVVSRSTDGAARGEASARAALSALETAGLVDADKAADAAGRIGSGCDLNGLLSGADLVIESIVEDMGVKQELFARMDALARPDAVLASNTSGLSITGIAARCAHPERVVTTHFWNPPHLMPLVEIVLGERTSPELAPALRDFFVACGKAPVIVKKDRPGQLGNRLQMALFREAVNIVAEGIADAEDVDRAASLGFGLRLPAYGILEHIDMVGLELARAVCDYASKDLYSERSAPPLFTEKIERGEGGAGAGTGFYDWSSKRVAEVKARRDEWLIECLKRGVHLRGE